MNEKEETRGDTKLQEDENNTDFLTAPRTGTVVFLKKIIPVGWYFVQFVILCSRLYWFGPKTKGIQTQKISKSEEVELNRLEVPLS